MQSGAFETILRSVTVVFYSIFWSRSRHDTTHLAPIFANVKEELPDMSNCTNIYTCSLTC